MAVLVLILEFELESDVALFSVQLEDLDGKCLEGICHEGMHFGDRDRRKHLGGDTFDNLASGEELLPRLNRKILLVSRGLPTARCALTLVYLS